MSLQKWIAIVLPLVIAVIVFFIGEHIRRRLKADNEWPRKLVHIFHGLCITSWLFTIDTHTIIGIEIFFILLMFTMPLFARHTSIIGDMYSVDRRSFGDFCYPIGVIIALLISQSPYLVAASVLQLACADAVAALVGKAYGRNNRYKIVGATKSFAGSGAFVVCSLIIFLITLLPTHQLHGLALSAFIWLPFLLALVENLGFHGIDNLLIPVVCVVILKYLHQG